MSEQDMVKVYELAKELGIDSISLLDKLKSLNINVKNHMSELRSEEVQLARSSLRKGADSEKMKKVVTTKARKKSESSPFLSQVAEAAPPEKKAASPIIRRRVKSDGGMEPRTTITSHTNQPSVSSEIIRPQHPAEAAPETTVPSEASAVSQAAPTEQLETTNTFPSSEDLSSDLTTEAMATTTPATSPSMEAISPLSPEPPNNAPTSAPAPVPAAVSAPTPVVVASPAAATSGNKAESVPSTAPAPAAAAPTPTPVKPARPPIILTPRPVAPRRSILKIVEATPPPARPIIKPAPTPAASAAKASMKGTTTNQDKDGYRIIKMTKENLDQMVEEEAAKKRGGGREVELRPEDVRFADYRKKELVFLPKKKKIPVGKEIKKTQKTVAKAQKRIVEIQDTISVQDLASQLSIKVTELIRKLIGMGQMVTINHTLDYDTASLVAAEYQYEARNVSFKEEELLGKGKMEDTTDQLQPRPPVVTIMGHVDHGKTTLLDSIREANVAGGEAGGITQHIGAYTVDKNGKLITFIDTPGHEAFTVMRARGANVTDIVILVVSADDGVMPQTREALSHAQAARVPIIVAVNKIDKPGANPEKVKQALAELNLLAEDWGGDTQFVPVSALKKTNLDKLLDAILLQAEVLDLKANSNALASGTVLESRLEKGRGAIVSVLVSRGAIRAGDPIIAGCFAGKVKAMTDHKGQTVKCATPGTAVEILGFEGLPNAGETFNVAESESDARTLVQNRIDKLRAKTPGAQGKVSLEDLFSKIQAGNVKELNVIIKADAFGSVEAIRDSLVKLSTDRVKVKPILSASGGITESDVLLASASNAIIIGFNVRPETKARQIAEAEHVEIKSYSIIYELLDDIKKAMAGLLDKKKVEKFLGRAEVRQTFSVPKIGTIAGSSVIDGKIIRGANIRLLRDSRVIYEGKMSSLKRFKDDTKEVATGFECGIGIENYNDVKPGDIIEAYQIELVTPDLNG